MAASKIAITAGSGTNLATSSYTEAGSTVHDEKMILGEQYLATGLVSYGGGVSIATANDHVLELMAGASTNIYLRRVLVYQVGLATTAQVAQFILIRLSTAGTGGGTQTVSPLDTTDTMTATAMTLPTGKGTETVRLWVGHRAVMQTVPTAGGDLLMFDINFDQLRGKPVKIPAGTANGVAFKNITAVAACTVGVVMYFTEATF